ncbi:hypothetical protein B0H34DRAFT_673229 [Crassisporium funariophilum]|nr:hypothetical protein B0H34DRAFT_673229 [Crassisporium funariophilum]
MMDVRMESAHPAGWRAKDADFYFEGQLCLEIKKTSQFDYVIFWMRVIRGDSRGERTGNYRSVREWLQRASSEITCDAHYLFDVRGEIFDIQANKIQHQINICNSHARNPGDEHKKDRRRMAHNGDRQRSSNAVRDDQENSTHRRIWRGSRLQSTTPDRSVVVMLFYGALLTTWAICITMEAYYFVEIKLTRSSTSKENLPKFEFYMGELRMTAVDGGAMIGSTSRDNTSLADERSLFSISGGVGLLLAACLEGILPVVPANW